MFERHLSMPFWIPSGEGFLSAAWLWPIIDVPQRPLGVLIVPGIAMEDRTISVNIVPLAESLAAAGLATMIVSLQGTGQSSGDLSTANVADSWNADVRCGLQHMRAAGFTDVIVVAIRLSALVVLETLTDDEVTGVVLWAPAFSGRRYARELSMLAATGYAGRHGRTQDLPVVIGTFPLASALLDRLKTMKAPTTRRPAAAMLIVDSPERLDSASVDELRAAGATVDVRVGDETKAWLYTFSDAASVPRTDSEHIVQWIARLSGAPRSHPLPAPSVPGHHEFERNGVLITERYVRFSTSNLVGIYTTAAQPTDRDDTAWVMVISVQPGKVFVDFARDEAARSHASLRFDLSSNGLSPQRKRQGRGELNGKYGPIDVALAVDWMQSKHTNLSLLGFCSGAIASINVAPQPAVRSIVGINPPVFIPKHSWRTSDGQSGSGLWKAINCVDRRRFGERLRWKFRRDWYRWSSSLRLLGRHRLSGTRVLLQYDSVDPGWLYLRTVLSEALSITGKEGTIEVEVYSNIGHLLDRPDGREQVMADALAFGSRSD